MRELATRHLDELLPHKLLMRLCIESVQDPGCWYADHLAAIEVAMTASSVIMAVCARDDSVFESR